MRRNRKPGRRDFLKTLASGVGMSPFLTPRILRGDFEDQRPSQPRNLRLDYGSGPILNPGDFTYLGAMKVPREVSGFTGGAFTARILNGQPSFFMAGHRTQAEKIFEFPLVGYDRELSKAPMSSVSTNWDYVYSAGGTDRRSSYNTDGSRRDNALWTGGLHWHRNRLYWTYYDGYGVGGYNDWCIGMTDLRSGPSTAVSYGPWRFDNSSDWLANSHTCSGYMTETPDGSIAVGNSMVSGNASSSWGPNLQAFAAPDENTPGGFQGRLIRPTRLVAFEFAGPDGNGGIQSGVTPRRFKRENNYIWVSAGPGASPDIDPKRANNQGYWTQNDFVTGAIWVNLPDKRGVIFFGTLATGHVWYGEPTQFAGDPCTDGSRGPQSEGHAQRWWIYNPDDLGRVASGSVRSWEVTPVHEFNPVSTINQAANIHLNCKRPVTGAWLDPTTRRLYLCAAAADYTDVNNPYPLIQVFQIR